MTFRRDFSLASKQHHNTETALIKVSTFVDSANTPVLVLPDVCEAFDTVGHKILFKTGKLGRIIRYVLGWFRSYFKGRGCVVSIGDHKFELITMKCEDPQGSLFGLQHGSCCILGQILHDNDVAYHSYADDIALSPTD